jgi:hypothetical protein
MEEQTAENIQTLTIREWITKHLVEKAEIDLLYVIIGYLQEYFGGYEVHEKTVDVFFEGETRKAITFQNICQAYVKKHHLTNDVDLAFENTGRIFLFSKTICEQLKKHYTQPLPPYLNHVCFQLSPNDDLFKPYNELPDSVQDFNIKQYSFMIGVALKNKLEDRPVILFANASHKAEMAIQFIKHLEAFGGDEVKVKYVFRTSPAGTQIELEEDNLLWQICDDFAQSLIPPQ